MLRKGNAAAKAKDGAVSFGGIAGVMQLAAQRASARAAGLIPNVKLDRLDVRCILRGTLRSFHLNEMKPLVDEERSAARPHVLFAHLAFLVLFYIVICATIPIADLSESTRGIEAFVGGVGFTKPDGGGGSLESVATLDDVVNYSENLVKALLTTQSYRGQREPDEKLMLLRVHRLMNTIVFTQRRVAPTDCSYAGMKPIYLDCYEDLDEGHELSQGSFEMLNGMELPYKSGMGGFGAEVPLDLEQAREVIDELREGMFWDRATREFSVLFAFHNSPGHYTGNVRVTFGISAYGRVSHEVTSQFLRLRPYSEQVGGTYYLVLQITFLAMLFVLFGIFIHSICSQEHVRWSVAKLLCAWSILEIANFIMIGVIIASWVRYMYNPRRTSVDFYSEHYQDILPLARQFSEMVFLSSIALLFFSLRIIELFRGLGIERLSLASKLMETVFMKMGCFAVIFAVIFSGFVLVAHVLFGPLEPRFATPFACGQTLSLWFAALGSGQRTMTDFPGGTFFLFFFITVGMVLLFNMFMALIMAAHSEVVEDPAARWDKPYNHKLADWICDRLHVPPFKYEPYAYKYDVLFRGQDPLTLTVERIRGRREPESA